KGSGGNLQIGVRDPNVSGDDPYEQSAFHTESYAIKSEFGVFGGYPRWQDRLMSSPASRTYLDGFLVIFPVQALTAEGNHFFFLNPAALLGEAASSAPPSSRFASGDGGTIADLAIDPLSTSATYLTAGTDTVWRLDTLTGRSSSVASVPGARRATPGRHARYVLTDAAPGAPAPEGRVSARAPLTAPLADIAYDADDDRVVGVTARGDALVDFDAQLHAQTTTTLSERV